MIPERNGVLVHCPEYDSWARADVYRLDDWGFIFVMGKPQYTMPHGVVNAIVKLKDGFARHMTNRGEDMPANFIVWVVPASNVSVLKDWR